MKKKRSDKENEEIFLYGHKLPAPDSAWCSECRKSIIPGIHNVVKINKAPTKVLSPEGKELGVEGRKEPKAFFHAKCFQTLADRRKIPGRIECEYCGILSMAKTLRDGRRVKDMCKCSCHTGSSFCSLFID